KLYTSGTNTYYITVDAVRYNDKSPWPPAADGSGSSLQRKLPAGFGHEPASWEAAPPTPGADLPLRLPPAFLSQPRDRITTSGRSVTFSVRVAGSEPLYLQWRFNGAPIPGAGDTNLVLSNLQLADEGSYSVWIYNAFGSNFSAEASLAVLA